MSNPPKTRKSSIRHGSRSTASRASERVTARYSEGYLAPSAGPVVSMEMPGSDRALFAPDEHVVEPETYSEMIDGQVIEAAPAESPHADTQIGVSYVLRANVAEGYIGSTELLTRVSEADDFATDACIRRQGTDAGGHRHLEELSFEVKHTQTEASLQTRARYLIGRGVRRVFAVYVQVERRDGQEHVKAGPVKEWSPGRDDWVELSADSHIADRCFRRPLKVRALLEAVEADNAVARALIDKDNPVILELRESSYDAGWSDGLDEGIARGRRETVRMLCQLFDVELTPDRDEHIASLDALGLQALLGRLQQHRGWAVE